MENINTTSTTENRDYRGLNKDSSDYNISFSNTGFQRRDSDIQSRSSELDNTLAGDNNATTNTVMTGMTINTGGGNMGPPIRGANPINNQELTNISQFSFSQPPPVEHHYPQQFYPPQYQTLPSQSLHQSQYFQSLVSNSSEKFILRCIMPRLLIPILMDEKISKFLSNNSNFVLSIENQASQLPYLIFEMELDPQRVIPISIFLNKIINGKPLLPFLNDIVIKEVPKNFIYQSKFLLPESFFSHLLMTNEELKKMVHKTLISVSTLPDCDEILIRVSSNVLKSFFYNVLKEIESNFGDFNKFNQYYYYHGEGISTNTNDGNNTEVKKKFIKFQKNRNQDLYTDKIILKSYYCGSLFRNFANFKYTLRTKSDCNLKIQRILLDEDQVSKSKDDDIMFIVYGPYQHNVEFAIRMIENYTKKYAHLKLNQEFDSNKN